MKADSSLDIIEWPQVTNTKHVETGVPSRVSYKCTGEMVAAEAGWPIDQYWQWHLILSFTPTKPNYSPAGIARSEQSSSEMPREGKPKLRYQQASHIAV